MVSMKWMLWMDFQKPNGPIPTRSLVWLCLLCFLILLGAAEPNDTRPNIVILLADDLGYGEVQGFYDTIIETPELLKLQRSGVKFTQFYANPVCSPSRCSLFTGKHNGHNTVRANFKNSVGYDFPLQRNEPTFASLLRDAGYATALIGKWCFGGPDSHSNPVRAGFDYYYGQIYQSSAHNMYPRYLWKRWGPLDDIIRTIPVAQDELASRSRCMATNNTCQYSHTLFVERALEFLETRDQNQPFLLVVSFTIPHPGVWVGESIGGNPVPSDGRYRNKTWPNVEKDHAAAITEYLDKDTGRILDKLDELDLSDSSLVIFTSDNGPHNEGGHRVDFFNSSGIFRGYKRDLLEGGIRVPFIAKFPGRIVPGSIQNGVAYLPDILPTLCDLAKATGHFVSDGVSLMDFWNDKLPDRILYWEFCKFGRWGQAVRLQNWKLIGLDRPVVPWELYDLDVDPGETTNLAAQFPVIVQQLEYAANNSHVDDSNWPTGRNCTVSDSFERSVSFAFRFS